MSKRKTPEKKPKKRVRHKALKRPAAPAAYGANRETVQWSFADFDAHPWFDPDYTHKPFSFVADQLKSYQSRTWAEIIKSNWRDHTVPRNRLVPQAQRRLEYLKLEDLDELWRFRFGARLRLWGIRHGPVFSVLWWDPQHRVCPSRKKP